MSEQINSLKTIALIGLGLNILLFLFLAISLPNIYTRWSDRKFAEDVMAKTEAEKGISGVKDVSFTIVESTARSENAFKFYSSIFLVLLMINIGINVFCVYIVRLLTKQLKSAVAHEPNNSL